MSLTTRYRSVGFFDPFDPDDPTGRQDHPTPGEPACDAQASMQVGVWKTGFYRHRFFVKQ